MGNKPTRLQLLHNVHVRIVVHLNEIDQKCSPLCSFCIQYASHYSPCQSVRLWYAFGTHAHYVSHLYSSAESICKSICLLQLISLMQPISTMQQQFRHQYSMLHHCDAPFCMPAETRKTCLIAQPNAAAQLANYSLQPVPAPCDMICRWASKTLSQSEILCCIKFTPQLTFIAGSCYQKNAPIGDQAEQYACCWCTHSAIIVQRTAYSPVQVVLQCQWHCSWPSC